MSDPAQSPRRSSRLVSWAVLLAALAVAAARAPGLLREPRFWAEEGCVYYVDALREPVLDALFHRHTAGYLLLAARLPATLAAHFVPVLHAPLVTRRRRTWFGCASPPRSRSAWRGPSKVARSPSPGRRTATRTWRGIASTATVCRPGRRRLLRTSKRSSPTGPSATPSPRWMRRATRAIPSAPVAVLVDTAAPVVAVASPVQGSKVAGTVTVSGTVSEPDLASFLLEFSRDGGATWEPIRRLTDVASSSFSLAWPTAGLDGAALLRAQA